MGLHKNVSDEKKKNFGQALASVLVRQYNNTLKHAFNNLKKETLRVNLTKKALLLFSRNVSGQLREAFIKWKAQINQKQDKSKSVLLERVLNKLLMRSLKQGFDTLKEIRHEVSQLRKQHLQHLVYMTQNKQKKALDLWARNVRELKNALAIKSTLKMMEILNKKLENNLQRVLVVDKSGPKKAELIR